MHGGCRVIVYQYTPSAWRGALGVLTKMVPVGLPISSADLYSIPSLCSKLTPSSITLIGQHYLTTRTHFPSKTQNDVPTWTL